MDVAFLNYIKHKQCDTTIMIIIRLSGGLGNQLFQYAIGRRMAIDRNVTLKLDVVSGFRGDFFKRKYELYNFNIVEHLATDDEIPKSIFTHTEAPTIIGKMTRSINNLIVSINHDIISEKTLNYDERVLNNDRDNCYLVGFWQSEKYFNPIRGILLKEITVRRELNETSKEYLEDINKKNSISVHFRNYALKNNDNYYFQRPDIHGVLNSVYYDSAVDYIIQRVENPHLFLFSDDAEMLLRKIKHNIPYTIIAHNKSSNYEDLVLMLMCKHQIIANSSFSWWAAWINQNKNKIVIAPKQWSKREKDSSVDIVPEEWNRI